MFALLTLVGVMRNIFPIVNNEQVVFEWLIFGTIRVGTKLSYITFKHNLKVTKQDRNKPADIILD